jgi:hypothetical protein
MVAFFSAKLPSPLFGRIQSVLDDGSGHDQPASGKS